MEAIKQTITTLHDLLDYDARQLYSGEVQLRNSLPSWIDKASSIKLKDVLRKYLDFVVQHVQKMQSFISSEGITSLGPGNKVMNAFIDEMEEMLGLCTDTEARDASLLADIQMINHYKISGYGTVAAFSVTLGMESQAGIFHEAEINEKQIDDRLSQLARFEINGKAKTPIALTE